MRWLILITFVVNARLAFGNECEKLLKTPEQNLVEQLYKQLTAYHQLLNPFPDPFINALTLDESQRIFDGLSFTPDPLNPGKRVRSILGETRAFLNSEPVESFAKAEALVRKLVQYGEQQLQNPTGKGDLYRGSVAAELLLPTLLPFVGEAALNNLTEQEEDFVPPPEIRDEEQSSPDGETPDLYPEFPTDYEPHTKDTGGKASEAKPTAVIEVNFAGVTHFRARVFNSVQRGRAKAFQSANLPFASVQLRNYALTKYRMKVNTKGRQTSTLMLPAGFVPLSPDPTTRTRLQANRDGSYTIQRTDAKEPVELSLVETDEVLNPVQIAFLTEPVGVQMSEWPDDLRVELLDHLRGLSPEAAAARVESYLRQHYLYSVKAKPERDLIEALKRGAFQCDMAAFAMVALLRDVLKIPARAVEGLKGSSVGDERSFVVVPGTGHAWVEAYIDGHWRTYDPTPVRKDAASDSKNPESEFKTNEKQFNDEKIEPVPRKDEGSEEGSSGGGEGSSPTDHQKKLHEDTQKRLDEIKDQRGDAADLPGNEDEFETEAQRRDLRESLQLGSLSMKPDKSNSVLMDRARHLYLRLALNPAFDSYRSLQMLEALKTDENTMSQQVLPIVNAGERALARRQPPVVQALSILSGLVKTQDLVTSFSSLVQIQDRLALYELMLDPAERSALQPLIKGVIKLKAVFQKLNEKERVERGMAEKFFNGLPNITKGLVRERYKISEIADNLETATMMEDLSQGRLTDFNLIRILHPLTDFIMDAVPAPAFRTVMSFEQDNRFFRGPEFLPATHLAQAYTSTVRLQPLKSYAQNLAEGTLMKMIVRRRIQIPDSGGKTDPRRFTILDFDTSGSMKGAAGDFQAALGSAFIDRALSDRSPNGTYRHPVMLMGFDDNVHKVIKVRDGEEAKNLILNHRSEMKNTEGNTDIMKVLKENIAQIVEAQRTQGEPLASANIILMSDGGSTVDLDELRKLFKLVDRRTPLKFMFVAINGTNPQLVELTRQVLAAGASEAFYKEFSPEHIRDLIAEGARAPKPNLQRELYTRKAPPDLPPTISSQISTLANQLNSELLRIEAVYHARDLQGWANEMDRTPINPDTDKPTIIKQEINRLRSLLARSRVLKNKAVVTTIVNDTLRRFRPLFNKDFTSLMVREREEINHLIHEAQFYAAGGGIEP